MAQRHRTTPAIDIAYDLRGKSAGQVRFNPEKKPVVRYNLSIALLQPQAFLSQTVPHEVAHVVTWVLHGHKVRPHGREWQSVMAYFGLAGQRCHSFEIPLSQTRRQRRWQYACDCREHQLSTTRHRRVEQGQRYECRLCHGLLKLKKTLPG